MICQLCMRTVSIASQFEYRVRVHDADSISVGLVDLAVCKRCAEEVAEMIEAKRRALA